MMTNLTEVEKLHAFGRLCYNMVVDAEYHRHDYSTSLGVGLREAECIGPGGMKGLVQVYDFVLESAGGYKK